jgi:MSHA biogenesis protein MshN
MGGAAMSVINQVLNQLEQRGAHAAGEQSMVRTVQPVRHSLSWFWWAFGLMLAVAGIGAWQWMKIHNTNLAAAKIPAVAVQKLEPRSEGNPSGPGEPDKLAQQPQLLKIAAPAADPSSTNLPASRLSFELSSVPLSVIPAPADTAQVDQDIPRVSKPARQKAGRKTTSQPEKSTVSKTTAAAQTPSDMSPMKQVSTVQLADAEFRKAVALMQQGRIADALAGYQAALRQDPGHDAARQALVALLVEEKRGPEAERVLQDRLNSKPDHTGFAMLLARLQVERGAVAEATATLEKSLSYANAQADYQAFLAALLQRQNRNDEAIAHYQTALQLAPNNGIWQMGYGISLQAMQHNAEAKTAFQRALDTHTLSPDLQAFVQQKLKGL